MFSLSKSVTCGAVAPRGDPFSQPSGSSAFWIGAGFPIFRTERSVPDCSRPCSLRLGFLGQPFYYQTRCFWQARAPILRPSRHKRDQKTFSAGPRSFNSKELWFPGNSLGLPGANPFLTRGTVESPAKCLELKRTAASNQTVGLFVQPLCWLTAALQIQPLFIGLLANSGNMRFSS